MNKSNDSLTPPSIHYMIVTFSRRDLMLLGLSDEDIALLQEIDMEEVAAKLRDFYDGNFRETLLVFLTPVLDRRRQARDNERM